MVNSIFLPIDILTFIPVFIVTAIKGVIPNYSIGCPWKTVRVLRVKFKPGVSADKRFKGVVRILTDLIEDGMRDEQVRIKAIEIIKQAGVKGHDEIGEIRAISRLGSN